MVQEWVLIQKENSWPENSGQESENYVINEADLR